MPESFPKPCDTQKSQPWRAHWPPTDHKTQSGVEYGVKKGDVIVVDGTSVRVSPAQKESGLEKATKQS
jgi:hypothetical protein